MRLLLKKSTLHQQGANPTAAIAATGSAPDQMQALSFLIGNLTNHFALRFVSRPASATGFSKPHGQEQAQILEQAFQD